VYSDFTAVDNCIFLGDEKHPKSIISIPRPHSTQMIQSNEKPVELYEYLISSYTNENDLILDNCLGSGSSFVAALNLNRRMIGIEKHEPNFNKAYDRIYDHMADIYL